MKIELLDEVNDCKYNYKGKCTSPNIIANRKKTVSESGHVWNTKINCTFSQMGTQLCGCYERQSLY